MNYHDLADIFPHVSRETFLLLKSYSDLLIKTNEEFNLIGKSTIDNIWTRHIVDSLQLLNFIKNYDIELIDVGTGAGLPGIILSIAGIKHVHLVECRDKKVKFLKKAAQISPNKITIHNDRIENLDPIKSNVFVCRAFAPLNKIFNLCYKQLENSQKIIIPKGQNYKKEINIAKKEWKFNYIENKTITSDESSILIIDNLKKCKK